MKNNANFKYTVLIAVSLYLAIPSAYCLPGPGVPGAAKHTKPAVEKDKETKESVSTNAENKSTDVPISDVISISDEELVNKPQDYLNKNIKFTAKFFAFSNLALDYKPALRSSRTHISFLVLRPNSHTPFSELKLALPIPKEKDPETKMLQTLKEGDTVEVTGHVFACALDEPWVDVLKIKKLASADKKGNDDKETADDSSTDGKSTEKKSK